jgi:hypothetical protein
VSPQEIETYRKEWFQKTEERRILIEQLVSHRNSHNCIGSKCEEYNDLFARFAALDPRECKHGRSWASTCHTCDQEHMEAFPEYFGKCISCQKLVDLDELDEGNRCFDCHLPY